MFLETIRDICASLEPKVAKIRDVAYMQMEICQMPIRDQITHAMNSTWPRGFWIDGCVTSPDYMPQIHRGTRQHVFQPFSISKIDNKTQSSTLSLKQTLY